MRCRISSKERQIYCLFKCWLQINQKDPDKNKNCEDKKSTQTRYQRSAHQYSLPQKAYLLSATRHQLRPLEFIKCSNKFNHYIYQMQRSIFGPLTELYSIWTSLDVRAKIYTKMAKANKIQSTEQLGGCQTKNKEHKLLNFNRPLIVIQVIQVTPSATLSGPIKDVKIVQFSQIKV